MLKVIGHIYTNDKESYTELKNVLEAQGYEVAYELAFNASVIKNVPNEEIPNEE